MDGFTFASKLFISAQYFHLKRNSSEIFIYERDPDKRGCAFSNNARFLKLKLFMEKKKTTINMEEKEIFFNMTTFSGGFTNRQEKLYLQRLATVKSVANYIF